MTLTDEIRIAQRDAGEAAVIRNLERLGLASIPKFTVKFYCGTDLRHQSEVESSSPTGALAKALDEVGGSWGPGKGLRIEIA